jgi:hypothetical protein
MVLDPRGGRARGDTPATALLEHNEVELRVWIHRWDETIEDYVYKETKRFIVRKTMDIDDAFYYHYDELCDALLLKLYPHEETRRVVMDILMAESMVVRGRYVNDVRVCTLEELAIQRIVDVSAFVYKRY